MGAHCCLGPQGTAGLTRTVQKTGPGTGRSGCLGDGWTGTRRSCSGEGLEVWGPRGKGSPAGLGPLTLDTVAPMYPVSLLPLGDLGCPQSLCSSSRESKELADLARLHPTSCAPNGLNPNLMVTGGPALAGSGRWSADPAAHLATHPWLPRSGSTSMWLAGHPYGEQGLEGPLSVWGDGRGLGIGQGAQSWRLPSLCGAWLSLLPTREVPGGAALQWPSAPCPWLLPRGSGTGELARWGLHWILVLGELGLPVDRCSGASWC